MKYLRDITALSLLMVKREQGKRIQWKEEQGKRFIFLSMTRIYMFQVLLSALVIADALFLSVEWGIS